MKCVNCESDLTNKLLSFVDMPLTDDFIRRDSNYNKSEYIADINIYKCETCSLVQNPSIEDLSDYYVEYEYSSGYSEFTQNFMHLYAESALTTYKKINKRESKSVIEVGSGDGGQLLAFKDMGIVDLLGVEPSTNLSLKAESRGVNTHTGLFNKDIVDVINKKYDICISSYTFDHIKSPIEYLKIAHNILESNGVLAIEIHDLEKIYKRSEWCLFEHEHTIYMDQCIIRNILSLNGFEVIDVNPIPDNMVRANSMIVIARKVGYLTDSNLAECSKNRFNDISLRIDNTIKSIDGWIESLGEDKLIGWGAGGRGVMTLAALSNYHKFDTIIDTNYITGEVITPKTHIPVSNPNVCNEFNSSWCLVFSFGYFNEIYDKLIDYGFDKNKIVSLERFYG
jgi:SAM-dependent methyltransferase